MAGIFVVSYFPKIYFHGTCLRYLFQLDSQVEKLSDNSSTIYSSFPSALLKFPAMKAQDRGMAGMFWCFCFSLFVCIKCRLTWLICCETCFERNFTDPPGSFIVIPAIPKRYWGSVILYRRLIQSKQATEHKTLFLCLATRLWIQNYYYKKGIEWGTIWLVPVYLDFSRCHRLLWRRSPAVFQGDDIFQAVSLLLAI